MSMASYQHFLAIAWLVEGPFSPHDLASRWRNTYKGLLTAEHRLATLPENKCPQKTIDLMKKEVARPGVPGGPSGGRPLPLPGSQERSPVWGVWGMPFPTWSPTELVGGFGHVSYSLLFGMVDWLTHIFIGAEKDNLSLIISSMTIYDLSSHYISILNHCQSTITPASPITDDELLILHY